jgi:hypothetical protein
VNYSLTISAQWQKPGTRFHTGPAGKLPFQVIVNIVVSLRYTVKQPDGAEFLPFFSFHSSLPVDGARGFSTNIMLSTWTRRSSDSARCLS